MTTIVIKSDLWVELARKLGLGLHWLTWVKLEKLRKKYLRF